MTTISNQTQWDALGGTATSDITIGGDFTLTAGFTPLALGGYTLDGKMYSITISPGSTSGLLTSITGGTVKNLNITGAGVGTISASNGALVAGQTASDTSYGTITSVSCTDFTNIGADGGGMIGAYWGHSSNASTISKCYNTSNFTGANVGGIVGVSCINTTIEHCYNDGVYSGSTLTPGAGGIVGGDAGRNSSGERDSSGVTIRYSYNKGNSTNAAGAFGGIVGTAVNVSINSCYNIGSIAYGAVDGGAGGIVSSFKAYGGSEYINNDFIHNCYDAGTHGGGVAGILGRSEEETHNVTLNIDNCYTQTTYLQITNTNPDAGAGTRTIRYTACYSNNPGTSTFIFNNGTGTQTTTSFTSCDDDVVSNLATIDSAWDASVWANSNSYPMLQAFNNVNTSGTNYDPLVWQGYTDYSIGPFLQTIFEVGSEAEWEALSTTVNFETTEGHMIYITASFSFTSAPTALTLGDSQILNGQGYTITHSYSDVQGLVLLNGGIIVNLTCDGDGNTAAAGHSIFLTSATDQYGTITGCTAQNVVLRTSLSSGGGITGFQFGSSGQNSRIQFCKFTGEMGIDSGGMITGLNSGHVVVVSCLGSPTAVTSGTAPLSSRISLLGDGVSGSERDQGSVYVTRCAVQYPENTSIAGGSNSSKACIAAQARKLAGDIYVDECITGRNLDCTGGGVSGVLGKVFAGNAYISDSYTLMTDSGWAIGAVHTTDGYAGVFDLSQFYTGNLDETYSRIGTVMPAFTSANSDNVHFSADISGGLTGKTVGTENASLTGVDSNALPTGFHVDRWRASSRAGDGSYHMLRHFTDRNVWSGYRRWNSALTLKAQTTPLIHLSNTVGYMAAMGDIWTMEVYLAYPVTGIVVLSVSSGDTNFFTVGSDTLTFTASDWYFPQTISITGGATIPSDPVEMTLSVNTDMTQDGNYISAEARTVDISPDPSVYNDVTQIFGGASGTTGTFRGYMTNLTV